MTETIRQKQQIIKDYMLAKGAYLDPRGRRFLEALLHETAVLEKLHFSRNAYYLRDRVLVGTSQFYSPRFYFRLASFNINIENIRTNETPGKSRAVVTKRDGSVVKDVKPEQLLSLLARLPYWFLQIDEDFADAHHIGEGFTTQQVLENPNLCGMLEDVHRSFLRKENRRRVIRKHIDLSLVNRDKHLFLRLTEQLKRLSS
jgi:uncharacterized protein YpiB (UPF0302 family)